jgi:hypothetical protein
MNQTERIKSVDIRRILYELRQRWGVPVDYYTVNVGTPDIESGRRYNTISKTHLPDVIIGSYTLMRKFQYSISFIRANSNFSYGGHFEVGDSFAIVTGVTPKQKDYIVYRNKRHNIKEIIQQLDEDIYALHLRVTSGEPFNQIHDVFVRSTLAVEQEIDGVQ